MLLVGEPKVWRSTCQEPKCRQSIYVFALDDKRIEVDVTPMILIWDKDHVLRHGHPLHEHKNKGKPRRRKVIDEFGVIHSGRQRQNMGLTRARNYWYATLHGAGCSLLQIAAAHRWLKRRTGQRFDRITAQQLQHYTDMLWSLGKQQPGSVAELAERWRVLL